MRIPDDLRAAFPILSESMSGKPLIYLDNAATTHKPQHVLDAWMHYYTHANSNIHRSANELSARSGQMYDSARETVAEFVHANEPCEIIFVRGVTEAINMLAYSWCADNLKAGDRILLPVSEHHSNWLPWLRAAAQVGARIDIIPLTDRCELNLAAYEQLLAHGRVKLVTVAHVSNVTGIQYPIKIMAQLAHRYGAKIVVDGAQSLVHCAIDVQDLDCDCFVASGHKSYAPMGIGFLYGKKAILETLLPYQLGGGMISYFKSGRITYKDLPDRLEAGTPNIGDAVAFAEALCWLKKYDLSHIHAHEVALIQRARERLSQMPGLQIIGNAETHFGVLSCTVDGVHPHDAASVLSARGIAVRSGQHCCQPFMQVLGIPGTVRISVACYNTLEEVDKTCDALAQLPSFFK